jgi:hypothetical protein
MIHVGVDRPQRFCYMTAVDATGRCLKSGAVPNQREPLREWLRSLPAPREVAVKACSFWPTSMQKCARLDRTQPSRLDQPVRVAACCVG